MTQNTADQRPDADGWELVWSDEFDGSIGSRPDAGRWTYDLGDRGWGNNELQLYTEDAANASIVADPDAGGGTSMAITAIAIRKANTRPLNSRLGTQLWTYGQFEGRIKIPAGQGIWPAFWLLGADHKTTGWPACGEIDIMEWIGRRPADIFGTLHGPGYSGDNGIQGIVSRPETNPFSGEYHVFSVEWAEASIRWYFDDTLYHTVTLSELSNDQKWVYDHPFYLIINLAVGGNWPGYPDATTIFPQPLHIDFIRVYQRNIGH